MPGLGKCFLIALLILGTHKVRQQLLIAPARCPLLGPAVVIDPVATDINHAVDGGRSTQTLTARQADAAAGRVQLRLCLVPPGIAGVVDHLPPARRHADQQILVTGPAFQQQNLVLTALAEPCRQGATRRARTDDDVIKNFIHGLSPLIDLSDEYLNQGRALPTPSACIRLLRSCRKRSAP